MDDGFLVVKDGLVYAINQAKAPVMVVLGEIQEKATYVYEQVKEYGPKIQSAMQQMMRLLEMIPTYSNYIIAGIILVLAFNLVTKVMNVLSARKLLAEGIGKK